MMKIDLWELGYSSSPDEPPAETVRAKTPGEAQLIWGRETGMPDYNHGTAFRLYRFMEDVYWHYRTVVAVDDVPGKAPVLSLSFLDYRYTIRVDGETLADGEGMFTPVELDLSPYAGRTVALEVIFHPVPKAPGAPEDRSQAVLSVKPPCSYGWDWHPRLVSTGISGDVLLEYRPRPYIRSFDVSYSLEEDFSSAEVEAEVRLSAMGEAAVTVFDEAGTEVARAAGVSDGDGFCRLTLTVPRPSLWWCRGQGPQTRYTIRAVSGSGDTSERPVGFRRAKLLMNKGGWKAEDPATQGKFPITLELNGRRIFAKGSNFVSGDIFFSKMTPERYETLVRGAAEANMNIFRMWGGSPVNKEPFFDLCDRYGIMVWQEFTLSCNNYPDDPHYLATLEKEMASVIRRLRTHPCVVLWCGGNELFCSWSGMTAQSHAPRLLDKLTYDLDRGTPYLMTSPLYGMGHGPYVNIIDDASGREAVSLFIDSPRTAYTEFGSPAPASFAYLKQYAADEELAAPMEAGTVWEAHHAVLAHKPRDTWFRLREIEAYFGDTGTLEENCRRGQIIQACGYKALFEEARRKFPYTSMAINWCYNEPWPCFANNSLLSYPDVKKPAYEAVREALRDTMLSARFYKLRHRGGDRVSAELWLLNDLPVSSPAGAYTVTLVWGEQREEIASGEYGAGEPNSSAKIGEFCFTVPAGAPRTFTVEVTADDPALSSAYTLFHVGDGGERSGAP